jgi:preprotein translocase subunit YajC
VFGVAKSAKFHAFLVMNISVLFSTFAQAAPAAGAQPPGIGGVLVPMVLIFCIMYFMMIRPQNQKQKKLTEMISNLQTGDPVVTTGGIHGVVANVKDGATLMLKVADNVRIEVDKSAIAVVLKEAKLEKV